MYNNICTKTNATHYWRANASAKFHEVKILYCTKQCRLQTENRAMEIDNKVGLLCLPINLEYRNLRWDLTSKLYTCNFGAKIRYIKTCHTISWTVYVCLKTMIPSCVRQRHATQHSARYSVAWSVIPIHLKLHATFCPTQQSCVAFKTPTLDCWVILSFARKTLLIWPK